MLKIPTTIAIIIAAVCVIVVPTVLLLAIKSDKKIKVITYIAISLFFVVLACGVLGKISIGKDVVSVSFDFSNYWADKAIHWDFNIDKTDLLLNIFMLIPIGAFSVVRLKNKKLSILFGLILGLLTGFVIESVQYILPVYRSVQLSDIVLNGISGLIGAIYYYLVYLLRQKIHK